MRWPWLVALLAACASELPPSGPPHDEWDDKLADRAVDYSAALKIAALRLTGELPTLFELEELTAAADPKAAYEAQITAYLASPKLTRQMFYFWQDTMKLGGSAERDTAAAFVAELVATDQPYTAIFTATSGTCPTYDGTTITPGDCSNGGTTVGLLTHPGMNEALFSNFGFRRVRWLQETFECSKFPAELSTTPVDVGGATPYTGTFPFDSIAGKVTGGRVDFRDVSALICANCHSNINHLAPLFAHYDGLGQYQSTIVVPTPLAGNPVAQASDYLAPGEGLAWRAGMAVTDMTSLGRAIAADPATAQCAIARLWDWAMGKPDIVDGAARVPAETIAAQVQAFASGGYRVRDALRAIFTSDDFVRF